MESQYESKKNIGFPQAEGNPSSQSQDDADNSYMPGLNDDLALLCLAKTSRTEYGKFSSINRRYLSLSQSGDLYKMRREMGISEHWVFIMVASGQHEWRAFDPKSGLWIRLPILSKWGRWRNFDSLCAGTQLLVFGEYNEGLATWRYELLTNKWFNGPPMITPRYSFASASSADFALVAGGIGGNGQVLKCAEKYDVEKGMWEPLPDMLRARKLCSGCFMDNRFYVIGGTTGEFRNLTCGEFYDFETKKWELISDMMPHSNPSLIAQAPPLVAVVNNELYALEPSTNQLKHYGKQTKKWKDLGQVPVRAYWGYGLEVAFKSLGDHLLLIGSFDYDDGYYIYTSCPEPNKPEANWHFVARVAGSVFSCAIMSA